MATTQASETGPRQLPPLPPRDEGEALRGILRNVLRSWWLIALLAVIAAAAAAAHEKSRTTKYETSTLLLFADPSYEAVIAGGGYNPIDTQRRARTNTQLIGLARVAIDAADRAGNGVTVGEILGGVSVTSSAESDLLQVKARSDSGVRAAAMANGVAKAYLALRAELNESSLQATRKLLAKQMGDAPTEEDKRVLQSARNKIDALESLQNRQLRVVQPAIAPSSRIPTRPVRAGVLGGAVGALLGLALALMRPPRRWKPPAE
jgi:uncharacterized protein involved in exopolysaccharide biosynthesis